MYHVSTLGRAPSNEMKWNVIKKCDNAMKAQAQTVCDCIHIHGPWIVWYSFLLSSNADRMGECGIWGIISKNWISNVLCWHCVSKMLWMPFEIEFMSSCRLCFRCFIFPSLYQLYVYCISGSTIQFSSTSLYACGVGKHSIKMAKTYKILINHTLAHVICSSSSKWVQ